MIKFERRKRISSSECKTNNLLDLSLLELVRVHYQINTYRKSTQNLLFDQPISTFRNHKQRQNQNSMLFSLTISTQQTWTKDSLIQTSLLLMQKMTLKLGSAKSILTIISSVQFISPTRKDKRLQVRKSFSWQVLSNHSTFQTNRI